MCRLVREFSPRSAIVVGGHVTAVPGIESMIDADHIVRGEGIAWIREYFGFEEQFGLTARVAARIGGSMLWWTSRREERRLAAGQTYEPPTFLDRSRWAEAKAY
jgi:hypothetical protein